MTKFFKTLEEIKASLPTKFNGDSKCNIDFFKIAAQKIAVVINGNNLEKYIYTGDVDFLSFDDVNDIIYDFKLLETCSVSNYQPLIQSKDAFEATLPKQYKKYNILLKSTQYEVDKKEAILAPQYVRDSAFFPEYQSDEREGAFFAPKTAIVTNGDKFQEILYTPVKVSERFEKGNFFIRCEWEVEYQSEVVSEAPISEVLAEFGL